MPDPNIGNIMLIGTIAVILALAIWALKGRT